MRGALVSILAVVAGLATLASARAGDCDKAFAGLASDARRLEQSHLVNIVVTLGFKGNSLDTAEAAVQARRYEKDFPGERSVIVNAHSPESLHDQIAQALGPGDLVHRFFVNSHGYHSDITYGVFNLVILGYRGPFLQGPNELAKVLSPLKGRFAPDATIVFEGCQVYPEDKNESVEMSARLMELLEIKSGRVYANYSVGTNIQDDFIHPKFRDLHDWQACAMVGVATATWPLMELFSGIFDYGIYNRGYLYTRLNDKDWCLDKMRLMKMRN